METFPLVSIIVPIYNVEKYLGTCLDSLIHQTYQNIEIICINDGSFDNSAVILNEFAKQDERIKIITQENMGLSAARNAGMKYARGKYTMFVDSDDWIDLETCYEAIQIAEKYGAGLVFWSYVREFSSGSSEKFMFWEHETVFDEQQVKAQLHRRLCGLIHEELNHPEYANAIETAWAKLYRTEIMLTNGIEFVDTKEIGTEDALFNLYVFGHVKCAVYLRRCFNHYRKTNQTSLTKQYNDKLFERWKSLFKYIRHYIDNNQLTEEYYVALNNRIALSLLGLGLNIVGAKMSTHIKIMYLRQILKDPLYKKSYNELEYNFLPIHWKLFYGCARIGCASGVYCLLRIISKIISK